MWKEFKKFALRGNVLDLAVGIIIGGAFNNIVSSLVNDIVMPLVSILLGHVDIKEAALKLGEVELKYGMFIQNIFDFLIIAFSVFFLVKTVNKFNSLRKVEEAGVEEAKKISKEEELLTEIRDLLAKNNSSNQ
ncbi:large conductance mechanosensitive channel protein MscL [Clostridium thermarum]|uniref:large conductance mechanosensitive channel protein MscL n=1 Tax=Clostridium thermarum TaxID=1716543 RepID=UPI0013D01E2C|nr:large conductance mechanosensitive channel protein MscL [Clostridium thermarum]